MRNDDELEVPYLSKRYICDVFREMRAALKPLKGDNSVTYRHLKSLVEESQTLANRMEAGLTMKKDLDSIWSELKRGRKILQDMNRKIREKKDELQTNEQLPVDKCAGRSEGEED